MSSKRGSFSLRGHLQLRCQGNYPLNSCRVDCSTKPQQLTLSAYISAQKTVPCRNTRLRYLHQNVIFLREGSCPVCRSVVDRMACWTMGLSKCFMFLLSVQSILVIRPIPKLPHSKVRVMKASCSIQCTMVSYSFHGYHNNG